MADITAFSTSRKDALAAVALIAMLALVPPAAWLLHDPFLVKVATRIVIFSLAAIAINLVLGYGGLVSLCHAGLFGIGGYVVGIAAFHVSEPIHLGPLVLGGSSDLAITLPLAMLVSGLMAMAVGAISLRTSGPYFIMITLAFNQMFYYAAIALQKYGGEDGLQILSTITLFGVDVGNRYRFYYVALAVLALATLLLGRAIGSRFGLILRAAAENETRVVVVGVQPWAYRLVAFTASGVLTGLAGALLAASQQFISPVDMAWDRSGDLVVMAVLGGIATFWGPILGAATFIALELMLSSWTQHWQLVFGLIILAIVVGLRGGLVDLLRLIMPKPAGKTT
ncbi:MAG: branched-chain amino acid ABC transporter permease [Xanthobacteraceae bacterium]|nr:MAG: branched-chain amino acid ABC transporter permease [Xanthobacteraceae bacterium]